MLKTPLNRSSFLFLLILCLPLFLSSCASADKFKRIDKLDSSLSDFRQAIRWGYYEEATYHIRLKNYKKPLRDLSYMENIRITSYEYGSRNLSADETELEVIASISFYDVRRGTVKNIREKQHWWFDLESKKWYLDGDIPDLTAALL